MADKTIEILLKLNDQAVGGIKVTSESAKSASKQLENMSASSREAEKRTKDLANAEKDLDSKNNLLAGSLSSIGSRLAALAVAYFGVTAAINQTERALSFVIESGGNFQQAMANTRAVLQPTADDFAALSQEAFNLGQRTVYTAAQAGDAFTELGKLGFNTSQILSAGNDTLALAAATQVDMARAATVSATVLNQFNLEAGRTGEVVDTIAKAMNISALDIDGFALSMKYVGPIAKQSGESIQETSAALGVLADNGLQSQAAGTGMRRVLTLLADSGSKASKAIASVNPNAQSFADKLQVLHDIGLDTTRAVDFFGLEAQTAATILANNVPKLREYGNALEWVDGKAKGYAKTVADIQIDTFQGDLKLLTSNAEALGIQLFQAFGPQLREGVSSLIEEIQGISKWVEDNQSKLNDWGNAALKVFETVKTGAVVLSGAITKVADGLAWLLVSDDDKGAIELLSKRTEALGKLHEESKKAEQGVFLLTTRLREQGVQDVYANTIVKKIIERSEEKREAYVRESEAVDKLAQSFRKENQELIEKRNAGIVLSEQDAAKLKAYESISAAVERAVKDEVSLAKAQKIIANETIAAQKKIGDASVVSIASDIVPPDSASVVTEEMEKAIKAANDSYEKLLFERSLIGLNEQEVEIAQRTKYWDDLIKVDQAGGAKHIAELKALKQIEIDTLRSGLPATGTVLDISGIYSPSSGTSYTIGQNTGGDAAREAAQRAQERALSDRQKRQEEANKVAESLRQGRLDPIEREQEIFDKRKSMLQEFHLSTKELEEQHQEELSKIALEAQTKNLAAYSQFAGGMSAILLSFGKEDKSMRIAAKAAAITQVSIDTYAAAIKALAIYGPTPAGYAAAGGATLYGIAQANNIRNQKYAQGTRSPSASFGRVSGTSYTGDRIPVLVNSREGILTSQEMDEYERMKIGDRNQSISITYAPVYADSETPEWKKRQDELNFLRTVRAIDADPSSRRMQAAVM